MGGNFIEIGREKVVNRGVLLLIGFATICLALFLLSLVLSIGGDGGNFFLVAIAFLVPAVALLTGVFVVRFDMALPRQSPVRINRTTRKLYFNSYRYTLNPFGKWGSIVKVWDWDTVGAEIIKMAGFDGKVYMVRYFLSLSICKPGTTTVVDREILLGPSMTTLEFEEAWAYICRYMKKGLEALPKEPLKDNSVHYIRSLFVYTPWIMLNEWGRAARQDMFGQGVGSAVANALIVLITLPLLPLFLLLGITNYIALKFAPEARWPEDLDAGSRGITIKELQAEKERIQRQPKEGPRLSSVIAASVSVLIIGWIVGRILDLV